MPNNIVVGLHQTADWMTRYSKAIDELNRQLLQGLENPGKGLALEQVSTFLEHRDAFKDPRPLERFFNKRGYPVVPDDLQGMVFQPNYKFRVEGPNEYWPQAIKWLVHQNPWAEKKYLDPHKTPDEFAAEAKLLLEQLRGDPQTCDILARPCYPICIPAMEFKNYGVDFKKIVCPVLAFNATRCHPVVQHGFEFDNCLSFWWGDDECEAKSVPGTRYDELLAEVAKKSVTALFFPDVFLGWSEEAQRNLISFLPQGFVLSGLLTTSVAVLMYMENLMRKDIPVPLFACAADYWPKKQNAMPIFTAGEGNRLRLMGESMLRSRPEIRSGGLLFVGNK